jgi:protein-S-isoprenylcysteine O-methyltransferase Ste14
MTTPLDTKVPPPIVALLVGVGMWGLRHMMPAADTPPMGNWKIAIVIALVGVVTAASGLVAFRRRHTTTNPVHPDRASSLVATGIYLLTRNPMYLGLTIVLTAWAFELGAAMILIGPMLFVAYISIFQIAPEERALLALFGDEYRAYTRRVRRWI